MTNVSPVKRETFIVDEELEYATRRNLILAVIGKYGTVAFEMESIMRAKTADGPLNLIGMGASGANIHTKYRLPVEPAREFKTEGYKALSEYGYKFTFPIPMPIPEILLIAFIAKDNEKVWTILTKVYEDTVQIMAHHKLISEE